MASVHPLGMVLTSYGLPHVMGYLATRAGERANPALGALGLMDAARELGLGGVELPLPTRADEQAWSDALAERRLALVVDLPVSLDAAPSEICSWFEAAAR